MTVTVEPRQFAYVRFDAATIEATVAEVLGLVGLADRDVHLDIDEASPVVRVTAVAVTPTSIVLSAASGAFEDTRRVRSFSPEVTTTTLGRMLLRIHDRATVAFAAAPDDGALTPAESSSWDTWSVARLARRGVVVHEPRWRYAFRNRHGFTDQADACFDRLWSAESLTWADLAAISAAAIVA